MNILIDTTKIETTAVKLANAKTSKKQELSAKCRTLIEAGFQSSALVTGGWYKSDESNQLNILGAKDSTVNLPYSVGVDVGGLITYSQQVHTPAQLTQVYSDGMLFKVSLMTTYYDKVTIVDDVTTDTVAKVEAVIW